MHGQGHNRGLIHGRNVIRQIFLTTEPFAFKFLITISASLTNGMWIVVHKVGLRWLFFQNRRRRKSRSNKAIRRIEINRDVGRPLCYELLSLDIIPSAWLGSKHQLTESYKLLNLLGSDFCYFIWCIITRWSDGDEFWQCNWAHDWESVACKATNPVVVMVCFKYQNVLSVVCRKFCWGVDVLFKFN